MLAVREKPLFPRASFEAKTVSTLVAIVHFSIALLVAFAASGSHGDQAGIIWVPLLIADFPISLVGYWSAIGVFRLLPVLQLGMLRAPFNDPGFLVPAFTHVILGTLWYYVLSIGVWKWWRAIFGGR